MSPSVCPDAHGSGRAAPEQGARAVHLSSYMRIVEEIAAVQSHSEKIA
jgi:hypothetical protein